MPDRTVSAASTQIFLFKGSLGKNRHLQWNFNFRISSQNSEFKRQDLGFFVAKCCLLELAFHIYIYRTLNGAAQPPESALERKGRAVAKILANFCSFSAVTAPIFASKYTFFSILKNLQDYLTEISKHWQTFFSRGASSVSKIENTEGARRFSPLRLKKRREKPCAMKTEYVMSASTKTPANSRTHYRTNSQMNYRHPLRIQFTNEDLRKSQGFSKCYSR